MPGLGVPLRLLGLRVRLERRRRRVARLVRLGVALLRRWRRIAGLLLMGITRLLRVAARSPGGSRRSGLPGGGRDRALLIGRDIRGRGTL